MTKQQTDYQPITEHAHSANTGDTQDMAHELSQHRSIEEITTDILHQKSQNVHSYIKIGQLLIEAKEQLENGHGFWLKWLSDSVDISERMAQHYMKLAKAYPNPNAISDLGFTKALALLDLKEPEREDFIKNSHKVNGKQKTVAEMSTRELKRAIREKKDGILKPVRRDDIQRNAGDTKATVHQDAVEGDLKSAKKHLSIIRNYLAKIPSAPSPEVVADIRSLHEEIQQCLRLAGLDMVVN